MTKQEEIREEIDSLIRNRIYGYKKEFGRIDACYDGRLPDQILSYLHSQGVVIKVDTSRLLEYDNYNDLTRELDDRFQYVAVEPLIKEGEMGKPSSP